MCHKVRRLDPPAKWLLRHLGKAKLTIDSFLTENGKIDKLIKLDLLGRYCSTFTLRQNKKRIFVIF